MPNTIAASVCYPWECSARMPIFPETAQHKSTSAASPHRWRTVFSSGTWQLQASRIRTSRVLVGGQCARLADGLVHGFAISTRPTNHLPLSSCLILRHIEVYTVVVLRCPAGATRRRSLWGLFAADFVANCTITPNYPCLPFAFARFNPNPFPSVNRSFRIVAIPR